MLTNLRLFPVLVSGCIMGASSLRAATISQTDRTIDSSCVAALDSLRLLFRRDYPGYSEKVSGHEAALAALTDSARAIARTSDDHTVCIPALRRWARFFRDPHITGPWQAAPPKTPQIARGGSSAPPESNSLDPERPLLNFLDDTTAWLRIPSFDSPYKAAIDSLLRDNPSRLHKTPYLIVDLRGNGGGYTGSYEGVARLVYTQPVHQDGVDVWASPANIAHYRTLLTNSSLTPTDRALIERFLSRASQRVNEFVELMPDAEIRRDSILPLPRSVAVLVDSGCASSCEDFVLEARQSAKVTIVGTHTAGVHDYGEVRAAWLPGWRRVALPVTRARGPRIDNVGITPGVRISESETNPLEFARRYVYLRASNHQ